MFIDVKVLLSPRTKFDNDVYKCSLRNRDLIYWLISYIEKKQDHKKPNISMLIRIFPSDPCTYIVM